ncbi:hypothetical protein HDU76_000872 [Blyttiomyces sp. JEL0837]|nr:hypothetical protein HDU76_000872 [Blyttiomyces sp. JEL0837]
MPPLPTNTINEKEGIEVVAADVSVVSILVTVFITFTVIIIAGLIITDIACRDSSSDLAEDDIDGSEDIWEENDLNVKKDDDLKRRRRKSKLGVEELDDDSVNTLNNGFHEVNSERLNQIRSRKEDSMSPMKRNPMDHGTVRRRQGQGQERTYINEDEVGDAAELFLQRRHEVSSPSSSFASCALTSCPRTDGSLSQKLPDILVPQKLSVTAGTAHVEGSVSKTKSGKVVMHQQFDSECESSIHYSGIDKSRLNLNQLLDNFDDQDGDEDDDQNDSSIRPEDVFDLFRNSYGSDTCV